MAKASHTDSRRLQTTMRGKFGTENHQKQLRLFSPYVPSSLLIRSISPILMKHFLSVSASSGFSLSFVSNFVLPIACSSILTSFCRLVPPNLLHILQIVVFSLYYVAP